MLQMPDSVSFITMVCHADEVAQAQVIHAGLLLNLPQSCHLYILSGFLMSFRQVPKPVPLDKQVIPSPVLDQSACRIDLAELSADLLVAILRLDRRNVDFSNVEESSNISTSAEMSEGCLKWNSTAFGSDNVASSGLQIMIVLLSKYILCIISELSYKLTKKMMSSETNLIFFRI